MTKLIRENAEELAEVSCMVIFRGSAIADGLYEQLDAICMGMPVSRGVGGIANSAKALDHFAVCPFCLIGHKALIHVPQSLAMFTHGETSLNTPGFLNLSIRQPFGVVAGIVPWCVVYTLQNSATLTLLIFRNVPIGMACWKIGPAIVSGNAILLKTSEKSPLSVRDLC